MIDLGLFFLIVWMLHNAAVDVSCAIKGTENPRYALKRQRALAAGKRAPAQPRYGSRDWFADFMSDALSAQTEWRRRRTADKAKARNEAKQREERPLDDLAEAVREEPQRPAPVRVDTEEFPEQPTTSVVHDEPAGQPVSVDRGRTACQHCGAEVVAGHLHPKTIDGQRKQVCAHCAGLIEVNADELVPVPAGQQVDGASLFVLSEDGRTGRSAPAPTAPRQPTVPTDVLATARAALAKRDPYGHRRLAAMDDIWDTVAKAHPEVPSHLIDQAIAAADRTTTPQMYPRPPKDTRPDATIIQFPNPKHVEKEINMATSEVTGLSTAIAFAEHAAAAHASFATAGTEGYTGALVQHGVGDNCVGLAKEAQEASNTAAAKWRAHADALKSQLGGREFYQSNPDAGDKQFLLAE
ncbi:hypothetical protein ABGB07_44885 [Micromonosporaceae bacterium B7E4]